MTALHKLKFSIVSLWEECRFATNLYTLTFVCHSMGNCRELTPCKLPGMLSSLRYSPFHDMNGLSKHISISRCNIALVARTTGCLDKIIEITDYNYWIGVSTKFPHKQMNKFQEMRIIHELTHFMLNYFMPKWQFWESSLVIWPQSSLSRDTNPILNIICALMCNMGLFSSITVITFVNLRTLAIEFQCSNQ